MSAEAIKNIVLTELDEDDTLTRDEAICRAIDIALSLIDQTIEQHCV